MNRCPGRWLQRGDFKSCEGSDRQRARGCHVRESDGHLALVLVGLCAEDVANSDKHAQDDFEPRKRLNQVPKAPTLALGYSMLVQYAGTALLRGRLVAGWICSMKLERLLAFGWSKHAKDNNVAACSFKLST